MTDLVLYRVAGDNIRTLKKFGALRVRYRAHFVSQKTALLIYLDRFFLLDKFG